MSILNITILKSNTLMISCPSSVTATTCSVGRWAWTWPLAESQGGGKTWQIGEKKKKKKKQSHFFWKNHLLASHTYIYTYTTTITTVSTIIVIQVSEGVPHSLRPILWPRLLDIAAKKERLGLAYKDVILIISQSYLTWQIDVSIGLNFSSSDFDSEPRQQQQCTMLSSDWEGPA